MLHCSRIRRSRLFSLQLLFGPDYINSLDEFTVVRQAYYGLRRRWKQNQTANKTRIHSHEKEIRLASVKTTNDI